MIKLLEYFFFYRGFGANLKEGDYLFRDYAMVLVEIDLAHLAENVILVED